MDHAGFGSVIEANAAHLALVARTIPLDTRVPTCPRWTMHDLVGHLAGHYEWVAHNLDRAPSAGMFPFDALADVSPGAAAIDDLEANASAVTDKLERLGPHRECWSWTTDRTTAFWARRAAHESVMHAWDGSNAADGAAAIPTDVAIDGIDEYLAVVLRGFWADSPPVGAGERIQLSATDGPAHWHLRVEDTGTVVTRDPSPSAVTVRGPASDLWLVLMGRRTTNVVSVSGDASLLHRWHGQLHF